MVFVSGLKVLGSFGFIFVNFVFLNCVIIEGFFGDIFIYILKESVRCFGGVWLLSIFFGNLLRREV